MKIAVLLGNAEVLSPNTFDTRSFQDVFGREYELLKMPWAKSMGHIYNNNLLFREDDNLVRAAGYAIQYDFADDSIPLLVFVDTTQNISQVSDLVHCLNILREGTDCDVLEVTLLTLDSREFTAQSKISHDIADKLRSSKTVQGVVFTNQISVSFEDLAPGIGQQLAYNNIAVCDISKKLCSALERRGVTISSEIAQKKVMRILRRMSGESMTVNSDKHEIFADELAAAMMQDLTQFLQKSK